MAHIAPMIEIKLKEQTVLLDDEFSDLAENWVWHLHSASHCVYARGYPAGQRKGGLFYMHRIITGAAKGLDVDHKNGNGLDNRLCNLRVCERSQNNANRKRVQSKTSRFKGVHFENCTQRWRAELTINGKRIRLGRFPSEEQAVAAYMKAANEHFGEYASKAEKP
jgi:hypothetical protein